MSTNTLNNRSTGQTILDTFFNDIHSALDGDFVGRGATGIPTSGQNLGTIALPWGNVYASGMTIGGVAIDTSRITSPSNRVVSGKKRTTSNQPAFITPNGAAASFIVAGATTPLVLNINGVAVSVSTDLTKTGLTTAPASNNTCVVNDATAAGQADTKIWGEYWHRKGITIGTVGSNISALVGKWAAFKVGTEYFMAYVESATKLSKCYRGFFYNSSLAPLNRVALTNADTITLMSLAWVFVQNDSTTVDVTYNNPTWSVSSPTSPTTGDYWYDLANQTWKRYDGASFQIINRTFIGWAVLDSTNCVAARSEDVYALFDETHTMGLEVLSSAVLQGVTQDGVISVNGNLISFGKTLPQWNMTTNLATSADMYNATEQASTLYHFYVKDTGDVVISDIEPYYRPDKKGWYHPHNPWRRVGLGFNDGSSNLTQAGGPNDSNKSRWITSNGQGSTDTKIEKFSTNEVLEGAGVYGSNTATNGTIMLFNVPCIAIISAMGYKNASSLNYGISLNSTQLTTIVDSITAADRISYGTDAATAGPNLSVSKLFKIGDKCRYHVSTTPEDSALVFFEATIQRWIMK